MIKNKITSNFFEIFKKNKSYIIKNSILIFFVLFLPYLILYLIFFSTQFHIENVVIGISFFLLSILLIIGKKMIIKEIKDFKMNILIFIFSILFTMISLLQPRAINSFSFIIPMINFFANVPILIPLELIILIRSQKRLAIDIKDFKTNFYLVFIINMLIILLNLIFAFPIAFIEIFYMRDMELRDVIGNLLFSSYNLFAEENLYYSLKNITGFLFLSIIISILIKYYYKFKEKKVILK